MIFSKQKSYSSWDKKPLLNPVYIVVEDRKGGCEFYEYTTSKYLCTTTLQRKAFQGTTFEDYQQEVDMASERFPEYRFSILRECDLPEMKQRLTATDYLESRPLPDCTEADYGR